MINIENTDSSIEYSGSWSDVTKDNKVIKISNTKGDYAKITFIGTKIRFYSQTNAWRGKAKIYIDNTEITIIDTYSAEESLDILIFESSNLDYATHTMKIEVLGEKNSLSNEAKIAIYRFEIDKDSSNINDEEISLKNDIAALKLTITELTDTLNNIESNILQLKNVIAEKDAIIKSLQESQSNVDLTELKALVERLEAISNA